MQKKSDVEYFPKNYAQSRANFLAEVNELPGPKNIGYWAIPGKTDHDLFVDHAWFPPLDETRTLFVLTSGIHGAETYAGAAVQSMFINEIFPGIDRRHTGIFMAHAMNPYGFKHHKRCTEAGVNLNRNFSVSGANYNRKSPGSSMMCERFLERKQVGSTKSLLLQKMKKIDGKVFFDEVSLDQFIKATAPGQYERVDNWEFGGFGPEPQTRLFIDKMAEIMPAYKTVVAFDLHTGLGDRNRLHLLTDEPGKSLDPDLFKELIRPDIDHEFYTFTPPEAEGFYAVHGALNSAFGELAGEHQRVCSLTMEFGTLGHSLQSQLDGLNSFTLELQGSHYGFASKEIEAEIVKENFERSRPPQKDWEEAVIKASRGLFLRVFERLQN